MDTRKSQNTIMTDAVMSNDDSHTHEKILSPLLDGLPREIRKEIYPYLTLEELGLFAQVSHKAKTETDFLRFLNSAMNKAVNATPESYNQADETKLAAIAILKKHPELLFDCRVGMVTDHFGRKIKGSPYRLLLGAGDIWALRKVHEEIIPKIKNGEALATAEFQTQFPSCSWPLDPNMLEEALYDERNKTQIKQVIDQLKIIVAKITADPCTEAYATKAETTDAVADLCKIFAPKEGEVIATGLHFPLGIMKEIFKVYDAQFTLWSGAKLAFFSRTVIGGAEAALSAVDGQCVKNGLANFNMDKGPDRRDGLFCKHPKGIPENKVPLVGKLGRTVFVDLYNGESCFVSSSTPGYLDWYNKNGDREFAPAFTLLGRWLAYGVVACWTTYGEQKQRLLGAIMRPSTEKSTHGLDEHNRSMRCVIL